jgi:hypothetical protein
MKRHVLPDYERRIIAAEVAHLLTVADGRTGKRQWNTVTLGEACGGLKHETIRLARDPEGVGPAVRDGVLALTRTTLEQLARKHGIPSPYSGAPTASEQTTTAVSAAGPTMVIPDKVLSAKNVLEALERDGLSRQAARQAVSEVIFDQEWVSEAELYRQARALATEVSGERPIPRDFRSQSTSAKRSTKRSR